MKLEIEVDENSIKKVLNSSAIEYKPHESKYLSELSAIWGVVLEAYKAQRPSKLDEAVGEVTKLVYTHNWYKGFGLREILKKYIPGED